MKTESIAKWMREAALERQGLSILSNRDLVEHHERLVKIYYHAGRYAEGARDKSAIAAMLIFEKVEYADN